MFARFTDLVPQASSWAYLVVFLLAFLDAVFPVVPSDTAGITAGVVASSGNLSLQLVVVVAALGAFAGDNLAYGIGRRYSMRGSSRLYAVRKHAPAWTGQNVSCIPAAPP